jgi:hypothetical protein
MFTFVNLSRCAGTLCLIGLGVLAFSFPAFAEETQPAACDAAWHATAEQRATRGLELEQGYGADDRVTLWRLLVLGEDAPDRIGLKTDYHLAEGPFLPKNFADDPEVARILGLVNGHDLDGAMLAIEALTHIPDPANTDIATERLLVRSELLFAGVLWTTNWGWGEASGGWGVDARAVKWMTELNAHFLSLPLSILNHDMVVNDAYWRAVEDLRWFLRSDRTRGWLRDQQRDDWWLPSGVALDSLQGAAEAARESSLADWLQSMEATAGLTGHAWVDYLSARFSSTDYAHAYEHLVQQRDQTWGLPWQIAVARWWAPGLEALGVPAMSAYGQQRDRLADLERRAETCALTAAEQFALGPLRFHDTRYRALVDQDPGRGTFFWNGAIDASEAATANDRTRQEIMRFAMLTGQSAIANTFQRARDPKASADSYGKPGLDALAAPDLAGFAASNPDPSAINLLPLRMLAELIEMPGLRPDLRAAVARMAWIRAYVLEDEAILNRITPLVAQTNAQLKPLLDAYQAAWTDAGRRQAALDLLLQTPAMQLVLPDGEDLYWGVGRLRIWSDKPEDWQEALFKSDHLNPNDNNWWCRLDLDRELGKLKTNFYDRPLGLYYGRYWEVPERAGMPAALQEKLAEYREQVLREHAILKEIDFEELRRLTDVPSGSVYLAQAATAWTRSSWPWDRYFAGDRMADALAASIQATRWGCHRDDANAAASYAAWRTLQETFSESKAAENSPYWYR